LVKRPGDSRFFENWNLSWKCWVSVFFVAGTNSWFCGFSEKFLRSFGIEVFNFPIVGPESRGVNL